MTELSKAEQELVLIIRDAWNEGNNNPKDKFGDFLTRAATRIKEAGYRQVSGKAPLLTEKKIARALESTGLYGKSNLEDAIDKQDRAIAKAQNDADNKFYRGEVDDNRVPNTGTN